jgi:dTDP-4-dehydrorhamnose 3,5-epimerase
MNILETNLPEVLIIKPKVFSDSRGYFYESFNLAAFSTKLRIKDIVQDNESKSIYGVIRGLHYQIPPFAQSKIVRVITGKVFDVAVDIRKGSPTFGKQVVVELSEENKLQLYIPRGFAHGFAVMSEEVIFSYKVDNYYAPQYERGIFYNDPEINIQWPIETSSIILSGRDAQLPHLNEAELFDFNHSLYES